jgi:hypothetical protein
LLQVIRPGQSATRRDVELFGSAVHAAGLVPQAAALPLDEPRYWCAFVAGAQRFAKQLVSDAEVLAGAVETQEWVESQGAA